MEKPTPEEMEQMEDKAEEMMTDDQRELSEERKEEVEAVMEDTRTLSDAELIAGEVYDTGRGLKSVRGGARHVPGESPRLEITRDQYDRKQLEMITERLANVLERENIGFGDLISFDGENGIFCGFDKDYNLMLGFDSSHPGYPTWVKAGPIGEPSRYIPNFVRSFPLIKFNENKEVVSDDIDKIMKVEEDHDE